MSDEEYHLQQLEEELDEEIKKEIEEEEYNDLMARFEFDDGNWETLTYKEEYEDLQKRIDKAIKYIEQQNRFIEGCDIYLITDWNYVLDILKGSDKE